MQEFNKGFLECADQRFQIVNPVSREYLLRKAQYHLHMGQIYQSVIQNL